VEKLKARVTAKQKRWKVTVHRKVKRVQANKRYSGWEAGRVLHAKGGSCKGMDVEKGRKLEKNKASGHNAFPRSVVDGERPSRCATVGPKPSEGHSR